VPFGSHLQVVRECLALTGACLAVRREVFFRVGGFSERFPNNFNDVDFCLKVLALGLRNLWTPYVEAYHFESTSRSNAVAAHEIEALERRWGRYLFSDPYYNPNLVPLVPRWQPFDDWEAVARDWPERVTRAERLRPPDYLELNPDLAAAAAADPDWDPVEHFRAHGRYERRLQAVRRPRPSADQNASRSGLRRVRATPETFDAKGYLLANPDLRAVASREPGWDALGHLLRHGLEEGRWMYVRDGGWGESGGGAPGDGAPGETRAPEGVPC